MPAGTEIAAAVRSGELSAAEVVEGTLRAANESQTSLNGFTLIDAEGATRRAALLDAQVAAGQDPGPLAGVPIGLKDLIDQAELPNTLGAAFEPTVPERDAEVVRRIEKAGAVIIGRTGLHEFAFGFTSENDHFGPVRNPWDQSLSPGGSSGGSAAVVSAGVVPIAIGTDTGGSVRVPAALCGVMGLKVTHNRVPLDGVYPLAPSLDTVGPLARTIGDLTAAYRVMAADDRSPTKRSLNELRFGVVESWLSAPRSSEVDAAYSAFVEDATAAGALIQMIDHPDLDKPADLAEGTYVEIASTHRDRWEASSDRYGGNVAARFELAFSVQPEAERLAEQWGTQANATLEEVFGDIDALITPTVGSTRKIIGTDDIEIDDTPLQHRVLLAAWTPVVNRLRLPALSLPLPSSGAPPAAIQLIGGSGHDLELLAVGGAIEAAGLVAVDQPPTWFG